MRSQRYGWSRNDIASRLKFAGCLKSEGNYNNITFLIRPKKKGELQPRSMG